MLVAESATHATMAMIAPVTSDIVLPAMSQPRFRLIPKNDRERETIVRAVSIPPKAVDIQIQPLRGGKRSGHGYNKAVQTHSLEEFREFAIRFAANIALKADRATVVVLSGDLGAGKTTFTQAIAQTLGVEESVTSPTFVIEKIYPLQGKPFDRLIHIDAYRLDDPRELETLDFAGLLSDPKNLILLEWPERVTRLIPEDAIRIRFDIHGDERTISINGGKESAQG
jgi:tRNA threonylcarbamoyladenosine biosynthesis protein TsaE